MKNIVHRADIIVLSADLIGPDMAGPAIRYLKMAEALAGKWSTVLAMPSAEQTITLPFPMVNSRGKEFLTLLDQAKVIVTQGFNFTLKPLIQTRSRLIIDLYDPLPFEILGLKQKQGELSERMVLLDWTIRKTNLLLTRGDCFLYATQRQRDFWLGNLLAMGAINHDRVAMDPMLEGLLVQLPFGIEDSPFQTTGQGAIKGEMSGISADSIVFYWGGGLWDWLDPAIIIKATALAARTNPRIKTLFLAGKHPNPAVPPMSMLADSKMVAAELEVLDKHVFFHELWVPFDRRDTFLRDADVGTSFHEHSLEASFSFRTRVLDYLWAGLPVVLSSGDDMSEMIKQAGAGISIPPKDHEYLARQMVELASSKERRQEMGRASHALGERFRWQTIMANLSSAVERLLARGPKPSSSFRNSLQLASFYLTNVQREMTLLGFKKGLVKLGGRLRQG